MKYPRQTAFAAAYLFSICIFSCNSGGTTSDIQNPLLPAPSNLAYSKAIVSCYVGAVMPPDSPSVTGAVTGYSVSPDLPPGISLNGSTGIISGKPTAVAAAANYIITAANSAGSTTAIINLAVSEAVASPSNLSYTSPVTYTVGIPIAINEPTVTGVVTSYAISPVLPAGFSFNATTGVISGTPTASSPATDYTITASNSSGFSSTTVGIIVNYLPPSGLSYPTPVVFNLGTPVANFSPTVTGVVTSYAVFPALPTGLSFNSTTGVISGRPIANSPATSYTVTANNSSGSTSAIVIITVVMSWNAQASGTTYNLNSVTWTGSQLVAVGEINLSAAVGTIQTSPDGVIWTSQNSRIGYNLNSVTWTGSQLVAVGAGGSIVTSPDGVIWIERTSGTTALLNSVTWTGTQLVTVCTSVANDANGNKVYTNAFLTSPDGISWTAHTSVGNGFTNGTLYSLTWTGNLLVAVGYDDAGRNHIMTSPDGVTWTNQTVPTTYGFLSSVFWSGTQLITIGSIGIVSALPILTSPDGITWTVRNSVMGPGSLKCTAWTGGQLVVIGGGGVLTSPDGETWTSSTSQASQLPYITSATWTGTKMVGVGSGGRILTSP